MIWVTLDHFKTLTGFSLQKSMSQRGESPNLVTTFLRRKAHREETEVIQMIMFLTY